MDGTATDITAPARLPGQPWPDAQVLVPTNNVKFDRGLKIIYLQGYREDLVGREIEPEVVHLICEPTTKLCVRTNAVWFGDIRVVYPECTGAPRNHSAIPNGI